MDSWLPRVTGRGRVRVRLMTGRQDKRITQIDVPSTGAPGQGGWDSRAPTGYVGGISVQFLGDSTPKGQISVRKPPRTATTHSQPDQCRADPKSYHMPSHSSGNTFLPPLENFFDDL